MYAVGIKTAREAGLYSEANCIGCRCLRNTRFPRRHAIFTWREKVEWDRNGSTNALKPLVAGQAHTKTPDKV